MKKDQITSMEQNVLNFKWLLGGILLLLEVENITE